jgi:hypothetical protein
LNLRKPLYPDRPFDSCTNVKQFELYDLVTLWSGPQLANASASAAASGLRSGPYAATNARRSRGSATEKNAPNAVSSAATPPRL